MSAESLQEQDDMRRTWWQFCCYGSCSRGCLVDRTQDSESPSPVEKPAGIIKPLILGIIPFVLVPSVLLGMSWWDVTGQHAAAFVIATIVLPLVLALYPVATWISAAWRGKGFVWRNPRWLGRLAVCAAVATLLIGTVAGWIAGPWAFGGPQTPIPVSIATASVLTSYDPGLARSFLLRDVAGLQRSKADTVQVTFNVTEDVCEQPDWTCTDDDAGTDTSSWTGNGPHGGLRRTGTGADAGSEREGGDALRRQLVHCEYQCLQWLKTSRNVTFHWWYLHSSEPGDTTPRAVRLLNHAGWPHYRSPCAGTRHHPLDCAMTVTEACQPPVPYGLADVCSHREAFDAAYAASAGEHAMQPLVFLDHNGQYRRLKSTLEASRTFLGLTIALGLVVMAPIAVSLAQRPGAACWEGLDAANAQACGARGRGLACCGLIECWAARQEMQARRLLSYQAEAAAASTAALGEPVGAEELARE